MSSLFRVRMQRMRVNLSWSNFLWFIMFVKGFSKINPCVVQNKTENRSGPARLNYTQGPHKTGKSFSLYGFSRHFYYFMDITSKPFR